MIYASARTKPTRSWWASATSWQTGFTGHYPSSTVTQRSTSQEGLTHSERPSHRSTPSMPGAS
jgi:hypothetical protein